MPDIRKALSINEGVVISNVIEKPITIDMLILHFTFLSMDLYFIQVLMVGPNCGCCRILLAVSGLDFENAHTATIRKQVVGIKGKNRPITPKAIAIQPTHE